MAMDRLFQLMQEKNASDMFFAVNSPVHLKINGTLMPVNQQALTTENIHALLSEVCLPAELAELERENELNLGISVPALGRFRLSAFRQRGSISAVFRYVPVNIPPLSQLGLPPVLAELIMEKRGLMLIVGATGSGKSTTIAAMLDHRNELRSGHILTLEDPIEYLFKNKRSIVNQREIGSDARDFHTALRNSMRQAPDCILIGEIRDKETMAAALAYAQSGHLVLATLHANNSYNALNRIIGFYPLENRSALLQDLSSTVKAIVSQRLVPSLQAGGRTAAVEIMVNTRHIADLIEQGDIGQIKEAIEKSMSPGSQSFELALLQLFRDGKISQEEALANADSASNLMWLLNNGPDGKKAEADTQPAPAAPFTSFTLDT
ncbi:PilT/PilU family type 4a pilus ATPase [Janthinobacterium agaricidamnosum]|uniref:Twitching motility family protein n=1 Tax=Janthinobacterium agaricidamnosum NBRC 102515 = DSM 9628 TaxID=1349767 RepID=W0V7N9_9BURK|nr:PilT/PilU family type 4a pilus ATPase [Janthinobacterium agaricidamnosum]CDG83891.1 twitching motility family protein [Janthinobacterium agaricidamnosum NBRC 102515 = DSM 9628]